MADLSKDTLLFAKEFRRMCKSFVTCKDCELREQNCEFGQDINNDEDDERILQCVQRWHDKHPLKTYAQDFREKFPKCRWIDDENRPHGACRNIFYFGNLGMGCPREYNSCAECWNEPMPG